MCFEISFGNSIQMCCENGSTIVGTKVWSSQRSRLCVLNRSKLQVSGAEDIEYSSDTIGSIVILLPIAILLCLFCVWVFIYIRTFRRLLRRCCFEDLVQL